MTSTPRRNSIESTDGAEIQADVPDIDVSEKDYDRLTEETESVDYYSLLALGREPPPTDAQIRSAYRTLTLSFHPDKQPPDLRIAAIKQYEKIRTAYETLIDPKKRVVYDILGEEGVRAEWGVGGAMGKRGATEKPEVGVRAMDAGEFRRWFLMTMKRRERKILEDLVQAKGSIQVRIDAQSVFFGQGDGSSLHKSRLKPSYYILGFNFTTPFSLLSLFRKSNTESERDCDDGDPHEDVSLSAEPELEDSQLEIHASIGGKLQHRGQVLTFVDKGRGEERVQEIDLPLIISRNFGLGATFRHTVDELKTGNFNRFPLRFLGDSVVEVGGAVLPSPMLQTTVSKSITPVRGTLPMHFRFQTAFFNSPLHCPPILGLTVSRQIGFRNIVFCSWSSGETLWPQLLSAMFAPLMRLGLDTGATYFMTGKTSKFELGYMSTVTKQPTNTQGDKGEAGDIFTEDPRERPQTETKSEGRESWGFQIHSSPVALSLSINYARYIFLGETDEPMLSEWSHEGHYPRPVDRGNRAVRVEINATIGHDLTLGWMVSGTRRVGEFARIGFGIQLQGHQGLVFSVSWSRLGQTISLPIVVCPVEYATGDIWALAIVVPWATYSAIEFGILRPRERRKRQMAMARQQRKLRKLVERRKTESFQAISLMAEQVERRQAKEASKDGLVILRAEYGYLPHTARHSERGRIEYSSKMADVTIPVAALVNQGQLVIPSQVTKSQILGFYDPDPLLPKILRVRYLFSGREHIVEVGDTEGVICPMRSHLRLETSIIGS